MKNTKIFQRGLVVLGDLPKWKVLKNTKIFFKNTKIFQSGLVVLGDLPRKGFEKYKDFFKNMKIFKVVLLCWVTCPGENFRGGEKCENFSKWFHCNGQAAQMKGEKSFQKGLIVIGDLPRWKANCLKGRHDRTRRGTRAEKCTRKEVGLENTLSKMVEDS